MADFKRLMDYMKEYPEIHPEVIEQKSLFSDSLWLVYHANKMNDNELLDTDSWKPSYRHYGNWNKRMFYGNMYTEYVGDFTGRLYIYRSEYEKVTALILQTVNFDMDDHWNHEAERPYNNVFIRKLANSSYDVFENDWDGLYQPSSNGRYLREIWGFAEGREILNDLYKSASYEDIAKNLYRLMLFFFDAYQLVITKEEKNPEEREKLVDFTWNCRSYRHLAANVRATDGLVELYPLSVKDFTGKMKVHCDKHGDYEILVDDDANYNCPHCEAEAKEAERIAREVERVKEARKFIEDAKAKFGDFYDYSLVEDDFFGLNYGAVTIIHPEFGEFKILPSTHLKNATGYYNRKRNATFPNTAK